MKQAFLCQVDGVSGSRLTYSVSKVRPDRYPRTWATETPDAAVWKQIERFSSSVQNRFVRRATPSP